MMMMIIVILVATSLVAMNLMMTNLKREEDVDLANYQLRLMSALLDWLNHFVNDQSVSAVQEEEGEQW